MKSFFLRVIIAVFLCSLMAASVLAAEKSENVFYICDGASGTGESAASPSPSIKDAFKKLKESGGTVVVCGPYTVTSDNLRLKNEKKVFITSKYGGVDYQEKNGAMMVFNSNFILGGETEFCNITLKSGASYPSIYADANKLVLGENITSLADSASGTYMSVMGGGSKLLANASTDITVNSGIWQRVRGGSVAVETKNVDINLTVNGGTFIEYITLGSKQSFSGTVKAVINGGEFRQGMYAATLSEESQYFDGDVSLVINGGNFYGFVSASNSKVGKYSGSYSVCINGGDFAHLTEIRGADGLGTMTSALEVADSANIDTAFKGKNSFTNPLFEGADPWMFYHDGYYYYTATGGTSVGLRKTANLGDMKYAEYRIIYDPEDEKEWSRNLWSPEIYYYTDEEIGEGNGGWYMFVSADDGDNLNHRMYVLKCLDGDDLLGRWGNPVTGEVNVPQRVEAKDIPDFDSTWADSMSEIRIGGKLYVLYTTEIARDTEYFHQTINIVEMTNPWTIVGKSKVICRSEYNWESYGYGYNPYATGTKAYPKVVEGATPVYGDDGSVYIIYSGSGYWTVHYNLAQLKYVGGDPLEITSWQKSPEPILYKSDTVNGCGHASYVTCVDGKRFVCYHAYIGSDTSSGRFVFLEPYSADEKGVVIADGTGHPAPLETVYTVDINPMPVSKRISGFENTNPQKTVFEATRKYENNFTDVAPTDWFAPFVKNAYELKLVNGITQTAFSPDSTFTVAQALTTAANIHTVYYGKSVRACASGEQWYAPYVEYCIENGIINDGQFADVTVNITRGDMATVFANILPDGEYGAVVDGANPDVTSDMACYNAVAKLFKAGIVGGDASTGNFRPNESIKRSEACVIFTRIAMKGERIK